MVYEGDIFRPPSEADSLLVQATIGCSWNKCAFCTMYKDKRFRARHLDDFKADVRSALPYRGRFKRVFLCDGDALVLPASVLAEMLREIRALFPEVEAVRAYASARNILSKTAEELRALVELGLDMVYVGLESGSDRILNAINKGNTKQEIIESSAIMREAGLKQSVTVIAGLVGQELSREHMTETADALNVMQPDFLGMLVLHEDEWNVMPHQGQGGFKSPPLRQIIDEARILVENLELHNCFFTSAHASNYFYLRGNLPRDKDAILAQIARASK